MKNLKIPKQPLLFFSVSLIGVLVGNIIYDLLVKPDGYLYLDKDTKAVYASLNKDPDDYKNGSRLFFIFKA